jgi:hypothetical protein
MSRVIAYTSAAAAGAGAVASFAGGLLAPESAPSTSWLLIGGGLLSFVAGALIVTGWHDAEHARPVKVPASRR